MVQHHDGITATSKTYIETLFKNRMRNQTTILLESIRKIKEYSNTEILCRLFENNNVCQLSGMTNDVVVMKILHEGTKKKERVEIIVHPDAFFKVVAHDFDVFCIDGGKRHDCRVVFEAVLEPGVNRYTLQKVKKEDIADRIFEMEQKTDKTFQSEEFTVSQKDQVIRYEYAPEKFLQFSYCRSKSGGASRKSVAWNKYGDRMDKNEYINPGMYIMFNDGKLETLQLQYQDFFAAESSRFIKIFITADPINIEMTIDKKAPSYVDWISNFKPIDRSMADYFLKVESHVTNKDEFFHDSNGYLVAKRKLGWRPDYEWEYKEGDKINAQYVSCLFLRLHEKR